MLPRAIPLGALGPSVPAELDIPAIGVRAGPISRLQLTTSGALEVPTDAQTAGWFVGSPTPGQPGPSVFAAHVNYNGTLGVFARLGELRPGQGGNVRRGDGTLVTFVVDRVASYPKEQFPTDEVYGNTPQPQLRLITCGGDYDPARRTYLDNIVVYAHFVTASKG